MRGRDEHLLEHGDRHVLSTDIGSGNGRAFPWFPGRAPFLLLVAAACIGGTTVHPGDPLQIRISTDASEYRPGQAILLRLELENGGDEAVRLEFTSAQRYDFEVHDEHDAVVWRWSDGRGFAQMLGEERLSPGDVLRYETRVTDSLVPGSYVAAGRVTARNESLVSRRSFRVRQNRQ